MRRLLLAAILAAVPVAPAHAGPAECVVADGFPVCVGTCSFNDVITVRAVGGGSGTASCGGATASCFAFRGTCTDSARATGSGSLTCSGSAQLVVCSVGTQTQ